MYSSNDSAAHERWIVKSDVAELQLSLVKAFQFRLAYLERNFLNICWKEKCFEQTVPLTLW
jgi:hypothetical protein